MAVDLSFTPNPVVFNPAIPRSDPSQWQSILVTATYTGGPTITVTGASFAAPWVLGSVSRIFPFTMNTGDTFTFHLLFEPTELGYYNQTVGSQFVVTGEVGTQQVIIAQGNAVDIIPVYPLNGTATQVWLAFTASGPVVEMTYADVTNLNPESSALLKRLYDFGIPIIEKSLQRWAVRYIDNGIASISIQVTVYRPNGTTVINQTKSIGTVGADGLTKTQYFDISTSGELFLVQLSANANAGNISIIDMYPLVEPEGEFVEAT
jgi:hypothetical protein